MHSVLAGVGASTTLGRLIGIGVEAVDGLANPPQCMNDLHVVRPRVRLACLPGGGYRSGGCEREKGSTYVSMCRFEER